MGYKIAIVGATGNVGHELLDILDERGFPADEVIAVASRRSQGTEVSFGDKTSGGTSACPSVRRSRRESPAAPTNARVTTPASARRGHAIDARESENRNSWVTLAAISLVGRLG